MISVAVDDFDPLIGYSNYADWQTPDPSVNPTWYNASRDVTGSIWHEGMSLLSSREVDSSPAQPRLADPVWDWGPKRGDRLTDRHGSPRI